MNRIKDYYETADKFLSLDDMARYIIGTHFKLTTFKDFIDNEEEMTCNIFKRVLESNRYTEFRQMVRNYKSAN